jgi:hypothetical protein
MDTLRSSLEMGMFDVELVEAICRGFEQEQRNSRRAKALLDLLQAVVLGQIPDVPATLIAMIEADTALCLRGPN